MKGKTRTKDDIRFQNAMCELGCMVCLEFYNEFSPCSFHHIDGRTKPGAHKKGFGLCAKHHQQPDTQKPPRWYAIHGNRAQFEEEYDLESNLFDKALELIGE